MSLRASHGGFHLKLRHPKKAAEGSGLFGWTYLCNGAGGKDRQACRKQPLHLLFAASRQTKAFAEGSSWAGDVCVQGWPCREDSGRAIWGGHRWGSRAVKVPVGGGWLQGLLRAGLGFVHGVGRRWGGGPGLGAPGFRALLRLLAFPSLTDPLEAQPSRAPLHSPGYGRVGVQAGCFLLAALGE